MDCDRRPNNGVCNLIQLRIGLHQFINFQILVHLSLSSSLCVSLCPLWLILRVPIQNSATGRFVTGFSAGLLATPAGSSPIARMIASRSSSTCTGDSTACRAARPAAHGPARSSCRCRCDISPSTFGSFSSWPVRMQTTVSSRPMIAFVEQLVATRRRWRRWPARSRSPSGRPSRGVRGFRRRSLRATTPFMIVQCSQRLGQIHRPADLDGAGDGVRVIVRSHPSPA